MAAYATKGQVSIQAHYHSLESIEEQPAPYNSFTAGLDYWFRMRQVRLEFRPFLGFESMHSRNADQNFRGLTLEFQTLFYPMDWFNDCQCPTFGKSNDFVKKGFFFTVAPYATMPVVRPTDWENSDLLWGVKAGAGLDIGFSDYVTVSPVARLMYMHDQMNRRADIKRSSTIAFQFGIILGFRWDKKNF